MATINFSLYKLKNNINFNLHLENLKKRILEKFLEKRAKILE